MQDTLIAREDGLYMTFGDKLIKLDPKTAASALSSKLEEEKTNLVDGLQKAQTGIDIETILREGLEQIAYLNKLLRPVSTEQAIARTSLADVAQGKVSGVVINTPPVLQRESVRQAPAEAVEVVMIAPRQKLGRGRRTVLPMDEMSSMGTVGEL
jgi:hypothetical protein